MDRHESPLDGFAWCCTIGAVFVPPIDKGKPAAIRFEEEMEDYQLSDDDGSAPAGPLALLLRPVPGYGPTRSWGWVEDLSLIAPDLEAYKKLQDEQLLHPDTPPERALQLRYRHELAFADAYGPLWLPTNWKPGTAFDLPIAELHAAQAAVFDAWQAWETTEFVLNNFTTAEGAHLSEADVLKSQRADLEKTMARLSAQDRAGRLALKLSGEPASLLSYLWLRLRERAATPMVERRCRDRTCGNVFDVDLSDGNERRTEYCPQNRDKNGRSLCAVAVNRQPERDRYPELRKKR